MRNRSRILHTTGAEGAAIHQRDVRSLGWCIRGQVDLCAGHYKTALKHCRPKAASGRITRLNPKERIRSNRLLQRQFLGPSRDGEWLRTFSCTRRFSRIWREFWHSRFLTSLEIENFNRSSCSSGFWDVSFEFERAQILPRDFAKSETLIYWNS